jgi:hypothetical protein
MCENTNFIFYSNNKINKPASPPPPTTTTMMTTTTTATVELDTPHVTPVPTNNNATSLGSLYNAIIHRRITLRPASRNVQTLQHSSTTMSATDTLVENPAARTVRDRDTNSNVVYVTAVGASSDQQAIAYVNHNAGFNNDQMSHDGNTRAEVNYSPTFDLLHEDDLSTEGTTSNISQQ